MKKSKKEFEYKVFMLEDQIKLMEEKMESQKNQIEMLQYEKTKHSHLSKEIDELREKNVSLEKENQILLEKLNHASRNNFKNHYLGIFMKCIKKL